ASARAVPVVNVLDHTAKVTHEAAIGSVDGKQLETLMARGLSQEQAVDVIIRGMLTPE
ncbi:MAG: SufD family Fe-S cluster assembly protein, partial [Thermoleophilia bacterium]|nr:SufD family Fe-S cluster assembly protein [Thermoleophilia bacterium]